MYFDIKVALWERIKVPKDLEKEFKEKVLAGNIITPEDAIKYLGDKTIDNSEKLLDTVHAVKTENNQGEATFQIFDNHHNLIFSNDN